MPFCARIEIKINGIFFPLTSLNLSDFPTNTTCSAGSFNNVALTSDGYIILNATGFSRGRIFINNVNALNVTVSTNDGAGTTFSDPFDCISIVPLKLISFEGYNSSCKTHLHWKTGTEINVGIIKVQESENGILFQDVGQVTPKGSNSDYTFSISGSSDAYYRLKINDLDGHFEYSNILHLKSICSNITYQAIPNPASNSIEIIGLENDDKVLVLDILGRIVLTFNSLLNNNKFDIQKLTPGMYILQILYDGIIKSNLKIIKN